MWVVLGSECGDLWSPLPSRRHQPQHWAPWGALAWTRVSATPPHLLLCQPGGSLQYPGSNPA